MELDLTDIMELDGVKELVTAIISGIVLLGLWLLWRSVKGRLERVLGQTENSHQNTEYPNLRDEVTVIRQTVNEVAAMQQQMVTTVQADRTASRNETEGVRADVRNLSQRLDLHIATSVASRHTSPTDPV